MVRRLSPPVRALGYCLPFPAYYTFARRLRRSPTVFEIGGLSFLTYDMLDRKIFSGEVRMTGRHGYL